MWTGPKCSSDSGLQQLVALLLKVGELFEIGSLETIALISERRVSFTVMQLLAQPWTLFNKKNLGHIHYKYWRNISFFRKHCGCKLMYEKVSRLLLETNELVNQIYKYNIQDDNCGRGKGGIVFFVQCVQSQCVITGSNCDSNYFFT